ncbi:MAG: hypothetical protein Alis3KO_40150 [Aliiglaciecola sp.]
MPNTNPVLNGDSALSKAYMNPASNIGVINQSEKGAYAKVSNAPRMRVTR